MQLDFIGRNFDVTPALKTFAEEKFQRLERRDNHITTIKVVFHIEHLDHIAEATLHLNGTEIHASAKDEDMYRATDALVEKLSGQITKHKEKLIDKHR